VAVRSRRRLLRHGATLAAGVPLAVWLRSTRAGDRADALAALAEARDRELTMHEHYVAYAGKAGAEGYRGIAYLFSALAASELVHAQNHARVLAASGAEVPRGARIAPRVGTTRENLLAAVRNEIRDIDQSYPATLRRLEGADLADAVTVTTWAWQSERQHRGLIDAIRTWSDAFFETVARTIDAKTGRYYVCANCGSILNRIPAGACPICGLAPDRYRLIDPPPA